MNEENHKKLMECEPCWNCKKWPERVNCPVEHHTQLIMTNWEKCGGYEPCSPKSYWTEDQVVRINKGLEDKYKL